MMSRSRLVAAAAAFLITSVLPAVAGGWGYDDYDDYDLGYQPVKYGYGHGYSYGHRSYGLASVPVVTYGLVPVPIVTQQPVLIVNQGPTFVPTTVNYITPTVTYETPRVFHYGSSGYGRHHSYHRHHDHHRRASHHAPRYHARGYRDPGYK